MGGHGALICALKNPGMYESVTAFAPVCNPSESTWGRKALTGYLGIYTEDWQKYDATELVKTYDGPLLEILMDTGSEDRYLMDKQLLPENFERAALTNDKVILTNRSQEGYDHSYYFVSTFIHEHFLHHLQFLFPK